jgi:lactoylglutathione lyase
MSSVNLRVNVEKTLAIKEFKRDYSLMAKFFFILDPDGCKNEVLQRFGRYQ